MPNQVANHARKRGTIASVSTCNPIVEFGHDLPVPPRTAMEETALDLMLNSDSPISPMQIEAWLLLAFMLGLVVWGLMGERHD
ncbi:MAG: hypothetical protein KME10_07720 [Plectolyngbya sp. WJT66-NPBG17]|nr:hypothetical protein [Plectolyngbya sp. WJT66-NPBG17]